MWDMALLRIVPDLVLFAPRDQERLALSLKKSVNISDGPSVIRFPKGAIGSDIPATDSAGYGDRLFGDADADVAIVAIGATASTAIDAAKSLTAEGRSVQVVDPLQVLPVSSELIDNLVHAKLVVTIEDGLVDGGIGQAICAQLRSLSPEVPTLSLGIPKQFLAHAARANWINKLGLDTQGVCAAIKARLQARVQ